MGFFSKKNKATKSTGEETAPPQYYYAGLIVTSIKVNPKEGDASKVTFNEADGNGKEATFLKEIKMISEESVKKGKRTFEATVVSVDEAKTIASGGFGRGTSTPLFIVHGFNVEPSSSLKYNYIDNFEKDAAYYPIPVIWASEGETLLYFEDQKTNSLNAGAAMAALVDFIPNDTFPRKSLMMHSMGNHAVFNGACAKETPDVQFENIFMVAADVPYDIFHEKPNERYIVRKNVSGNKRVKADNFFGMLAKKADGTPKGKVYILHNEGDLALGASFFSNQEERLGKKGPHWVDGWFKNYHDEKATRAEFRDLIVGVNVKEGGSIHNLKNGEGEGKYEMKDDPTTKHSYQLEPWAVKIYEEASSLVQHE